METHTKLIKSGWLKKSPPLDKSLKARREWKKRYFTLQEETYRTEKDQPYIFNTMLYYASNRRTKGRIDLSLCKDICCCGEAIQSHNYVIQIKTEKKLYHIAAESLQERIEWLRALQHGLTNVRRFKSESKDPSSSVSIETVRRKSLHRHSVTDSGFDGFSTDQWCPPLPRRTSTCSTASSGIVSDSSSASFEDQIDEEDNPLKSDSEDIRYMTVKRRETIDECVEETSDPSYINLGTYVDMHQIKAEVEEIKREENMRESILNSEDTAESFL